MKGIGRVVPLGADAHQTVQTMLPWYVRGSLDADERAQVDAHLASCPRCVAELEWERRLQSAHAEQQVPALDLEQGLARVQAQIAARPRAPGAIAKTLLSRVREGWNAGPPAWRWALALQALAIVLLGGVLLRPPAAPQYHALGNKTGTPEGNALIMFAPGVEEAAMRRALQQAPARVVDGPTVAGAYVVRVPDAAALGRLRAQPGVSMAQSLEGAEAR